MVARQDGEVLSCMERTLAVEFNILPLRAVQNLPTIHKRLKKEGHMSIEHEEETMVARQYGEVTLDA